MVVVTVLDTDSQPRFAERSYGFQQFQLKFLSVVYYPITKECRDVARFQQVHLLGLKIVIPF